MDAEIPGPGGGPPARVNPAWIALLAFLLSIYLSREVHNDQVRNARFLSRIVLINSSSVKFKEGVIRSKCGDFSIPKLADGERVMLDLKPRAGCDYTIEGFTIRGDELLHLLESGRDHRCNVHIDFLVDRQSVGLSAKVGR